MNTGLHGYRRLADRVVFWRKGFSPVSKDFFFLKNPACKLFSRHFCVRRFISRRENARMKEMSSLLVCRWFYSSPEDYTFGKSATWACQSSTGKKQSAALSHHVIASFSCISVITRQLLVRLAAGDCNPHLL